MVHETERKPNSQENEAGVHPVALVVSVKTYFALCLSLVITSSAMLHATRMKTWKMT
jgi:hypothetical protein